MFLSRRKPPLLALFISLASSSSAFAESYSFRFGEQNAPHIYGNIQFTNPTTHGNYNNIGINQISQLNVFFTDLQGNTQTFNINDFSEVLFLYQQGTNFNQNTANNPDPVLFNLISATPNAPDAIINTSLFYNGSIFILSYFKIHSYISNIISNPVNAPALQQFYQLNNPSLSAQLSEQNANNLTPQNSSALAYATLSNQSTNIIHARTTSSTFNHPSLDGSFESDSSVLLADNSTGAGQGLGSLASSDQHGLWIQAIGSNFSQDAHAHYSGFKSKSHGFIIGADTQLANDWVIGTAFTYAKTDIHQNQFRKGDNSEIDSYILSAYTGYNFGTWYISGIAGYGQQQYESKRNTALNGTAKSNFDGQQLFINLEAGHPFPINDNLTITPLTAINWSQIQLDSYREKNANILGLAVNSQKIHLTSATLGARADYTIELQRGARLYPFAEARWVHELHNSGLDTSAAFLGGGTTFVTPGQKLAKDQYIASLGLIWEQANGSSLKAQVDTTQATARSGYAASLEARWMF